jgi:uncharacterized membrane protein YhaH (DUF805 family)
MTWDMSIWNYHKLALLSALFVFILLSPPVITFFQRSVKSQYWFAFVIALLIWSFIFIMLHVYSSKNKYNRSADDMD